MFDTALQRRIIVTSRVTLAMAGLAAPRLVARLFGVRDAAPSLSYVMRLFAIREAMLGYQLYQASDAELEEIYRQGIAIDSIDLVSAIAGYARGDISTQTLLLGGGAAGAFAALGYVSRPEFDR